MATCPNGHESSWEDFCSTCGDPISESAGGGGSTGAGDAGAAEASAATGATGGGDAAKSASEIGLSCPHCSVSRTEEDVFCESCGYDFASGTLPTEEASLDPVSGALSGSTPSGSTPSATNAAAAGAAAAAAGAAAGSVTGEVAPPTTPPGDPQPSGKAPESAFKKGADGPVAPDPAGATGEATAAPDTVAVISVDRDFFERVAGGGELSFPDPDPGESRVTLVGNEILIGRRSDSRGIYPEIDLSPPMDDPAVSHRHAMLRQGADGSWTLTDLDSTNGTYLGDHTVSMAPNTEKPLPLGTPVFVGAYTKVTLEAL